MVLGGVLLIEICNFFPWGLYTPRKYIHFMGVCLILASLFNQWSSYRPLLLFFHSPVLPITQLVHVSGGAEEIEGSSLLSKTDYRLIRSAFASGSVHVMKDGQRWSKWVYLSIEESKEEIIVGWVHTEQRNDDDCSFIASVYGSPVVVAYSYFIIK